MNPELQTLRLNARASGFAAGLVFGSGLLVATNIPGFLGWPVVGPHLGLLGLFLPGYRVTFVGSLIGFVHILVIGHGSGRLLGDVYNRVAGLPS
jgi:hypothetical protein